MTVYGLTTCIYHDIQLAVPGAAAWFPGYLRPGFSSDFSAARQYSPAESATQLCMFVVISRSFGTPLNCMCSVALIRSCPDFHNGSSACLASVSLYSIYYFYIISTHICFLGRWRKILIAIHGTECSIGQINPMQMCA